ncbi:MAG: sigma-70 family RNA polymerase sigma factor [Pirellulaceae bacterium]|jgi:RNA polymerase primary sigma factor/RNA polymerase sigma factor|nr:sigma-70 family RNA polymerase sigma factor [Pirellulaceae bacterium]
MNTGYLNPLIKQLRDQQIRVASRDKKLEHVNRAEKLLAEIDQQREYPYEYLCYRITEYRPETAAGVALGGKELAHDLRLFVEDVSDSVDLRPEEAGEPVHTVDELSKMFKVSTKTISRWREQGLVSRRFLFDGKRKRVGFLRSSVERFVTQNESRVKRGERFSLISDEERREMVERARRLVRAGGCPTEVAKRIARHLNRSVETVRSVLKQYDEQNPHHALFPEQTGVLTDEVKQRIYQQHRRGESAEALARKFCRSKTVVYSVVNEMRARRILELPLDYIPNETFEQPGIEKKILAPLPAPETPVKKARGPSGLPPYLMSLYEVPLLTREQEYHLFRQFNYLKYKATKLRDKLNPTAARASVMDEIEALYDQAVKVKNEIVQANLRLVVSIAKRHVSASEDFFALVSDGNMSLIRAVEKFDFSRGNKFSTYASWAIMKNYARTIPDEYKRRDRFRTSQDEMFQAAQDNRGDQLRAETGQRLRVEQVEKILSHLDERERMIIVSRYGLDHSREPLTLKEVGSEMGVTKERIRQIEARALDKARQAAEEEHIELLD